MPDIQTRKMTELELTRLRNRIRMDANSLAFFVLIPITLGFFGFLLGNGFVWLLGSIFIVPPYIVWVAVTIFGILGLWLSIRLFRSSEKHYDLVRKEIANDKVEVILSAIVAYHQIEEAVEEGPILVLDLGGEKLLLLIGQWLYDTHSTIRFEGTPIPGDDDDNLATDMIELIRTPITGIVLSLTWKGNPLRPSKIWPPLEAYPIGESELLDGTLENLPDILRSKEDRWNKR